MHFEFLLLGLIGEHVRGYYSGKGKSGGGKFIGGSMGSKEKADEYSDLRKAAAGGDTDAKKKMEAMRDKANQERLSGAVADIPVRSKGSAFFSKHISGNWKEKHSGVKKITEAFDFDKPIDTGSYIGTAKVQRLNPPSKKYPQGSVSLKNDQGETATFDLVLLADTVRKMS